MNINQICQAIDAQPIVKSTDFDSIKFEYAFASDLMSDVMAFVKRDVMLLTGLVTPQVIRTVEMMDIRVIVFVRGKIPDSSVTSLANEKNITILATKLSMFDACGKLYHDGIRCKI